ncbi:MAG: DEAD/DEAH box helicase [Hydrogenophilales bacterium]|nr:DEAD/DEAH box helicase [Hydrogenophilales bacterium]
MHFSDLGLAEELVRAVTEHGYTTPTPIQAQAIPAVLSGGDLLAGAQTGTGKTAGFVLPILQRLSQNPAQGASTGRAPVRALIMTPTRELTAQVEESVRTYGKYTKLTSMSMFGGVNINPQITRLRSRIDILVATPGRLLDHVQQKTLDLSKIEILVLDEADRMLDMGFIRDIKKILALLPKKRQNLLFSATFSDEIKSLADNLLDNPALIEVARRNATADNITQKVYEVNRDQKRQVLSHLIKTHQWYQVLVFTRTKHGANRLAEQLEKDDIPAMAIHGNKSQAARTRALAEFKKGDLQVLVATDIAARGIDISELPHVVNYELPNVPEDYVHRIGRTGRAGSDGEATSLVCVDEFEYLRGIERIIKRSLPREILAGFEPDPNARAQPIQMRSSEHQNAPRGRGGPSRSGQGQPRSAQGKPAQPGSKPGAPSAGPGQPRPKARPGGEVAGGRPGGSHRSGGRGR